MPRQVTGVVTLLVTLALASSAHAEECPGLADRLTAVDGALERRPEDATLHFYKALFLARCGLARQAATALAAVERHGDGFLPVSDFGFEPIWNEPAFRVARARLEAKLPLITDARVAFTAQGADLIPEGIAVDPATGVLYMGSMKRYEILALDPDGGQRRIAGPDDGLGQILGLVVDRERGQLLSVDIGPLVPEGEPRRTGAAIAIDLESGAVMRRLPAEGAGQLNDLTVAPDGTIYATDSLTGTLWRALPDAEVLDRWLPETAIPGANGLALSDDAGVLYLAHSTGIAHIDVATGEVTPLIPNDTRETLGAIDGLYQRGGTLYGIQNVTNPGRAIAIDLDPTGTRAVQVRTLLSHHHPTLAEPTTGALHADQFLILANSHVARLQPDGTIRDPESVGPPVVLSVGIDE